MTEYTNDRSGTVDPRATEAEAREIRARGLAGGNARTQPSTTTLLSETLGRLGGLIRGEVDLARAEISENMTRAAVAIGLLAGAIVVSLVALNVLAAALVAAITEAGIDAGWSALIVGVVFGVIAAGMIAKGTKDLKLSSLAPTRSIKHARATAAAVKEEFK